MGVTLPSIRIPLLCLAALLAVLVVAAPAAEAKGPTGGKAKGGAVCTASAGALRPSPLRACVRKRKAPRAMPSSRRTDAVSRAKRRRAAEARVVAMMG